MLAGLAILSVLLAGASLAHESKHGAASGDPEAPSTGRHMMGQGMGQGIGQGMGHGMMSWTGR